MRIFSFGLAASLSAVIAQPVESQNVPAIPAITYADLADLGLNAPFVAHVRIADVDVLSEREAPNVAPGHRRFLVDADVVALIRGPEASPQRITYLVDLPNDPRGRAARLREREEKLVMAKVGISCSINSSWISIVPWMKPPSVSFQRRS